ncbi:MAG: hypothetical protein M9939_23600 [Mesorhizobium sp.]|nr:citrate/2-methylcitrate synthase [Mesorhizobium sp.]MCO5164089.1 hypothetical protein [Mesorhizobium sp.]
MDFRTQISTVAPGSVTLRGYAAEDVIANAPAGETLFLLLAARRPSSVELKIFDAIIACCADHGFANTAAVAGRYVMSGSGHLPAALAAAILSFGQSTGTAHLTAEMLSSLNGAGSGEVTDQQIEDYVARMCAGRLAVPGLGHPVHRDTDPRETALRSVVVDAGFASRSAVLLDRVRHIANLMIGRDLVLNVDGLFGALLLDMGFSPDAIFAVNIIGAMPGLAAHAIEERQQGRRLRIPPAETISYADAPDGLNWADRR